MFVGVVLFMYKEPKDAAKVAEAGEIFGIGEFLLVSDKRGKTDSVDSLGFSLFPWSSMV